MTEMLNHGYLQICASSGCMADSPRAKTREEVDRLALEVGWAKCDGRWYCPRHHVKALKTPSSEDQATSMGELPMSDAEKQSEAIAIAYTKLFYGAAWVPWGQQSRECREKWMSFHTQVLKIFNTYLANVLATEIAKQTNLSIVALEAKFATGNTEGVKEDNKEQCEKKGRMPRMRDRIEILPAAYDTQSHRVLVGYVSEVTDERFTVNQTGRGVFYFTMSDEGILWRRPTIPHGAIGEPILKICCWRATCTSQAVCLRFNQYHGWLPCCEACKTRESAPSGVQG